MGILCYNGCMDSATRRGGVFLTPLHFAEKAHEYLESTLGKDWYQSGDYRLWDMAAGTGHLEHFLPKDALKYCYLSTLEQKDVEHLRQKFPSATVFQYNYLDDDVAELFKKSGGHFRMSGGRKPPGFGRFGSDSPGGLRPPLMRDDLANPKIKWLILVNPPYATAQEAGLKGASKSGVSDTKIRKQMHANGLGEVSRELYVQFLYRIMHEFQHRETLLGLFSPLKYLISTNYQKFRDNVFHAAFQSGFVFSSDNFGGTSKTSHFPVAFILWEMSAAVCRLPSAVSLDILDTTAQKIGTKTVKPENRNDFLSRWIKRPRATVIFPPFGSALTIKSGNVDTRNRIAEDFLASLMCPGNELQNQQQTAFLSGPQASAGALSVTPENFEQAVLVFAARRVPKDTWLNHVDQLLRPNRKLSPQFVSNCAVWSLFDNKNQTVALRNVEYQNRVYQIVNHFFPFPFAEVQNWSNNTEINLCVPLRLNTTAKNSFVADWLAKQKLSIEAQAVLTITREIYRLFVTNWDVLPRAEFGIETYDAGWYQIRQTLLTAKLGADLLADLKHRHDQLRETILPQLYDYGILR